MTLRSLKAIPFVVVLLTGCSKGTVEAVGTVRTAEGAPIAGADVRIWKIRYSRDDSAESTATTDTEGRYSVSFSYDCGVVNCELDGEVVADADGYESVVASVPFGEGNVVDFVLPAYDELPLEATGIPDEQPRPPADKPSIWTFRAELPDLADEVFEENDPLADYNDRIVRDLPGRCDAWVTEYGRRDQLVCTDADGNALGQCFRNAARGRVLCYPDGLFAFRSVVELAPDVSLPERRAVPVDGTTQPLQLWIATDSRATESTPACSPPETPLFTNLGERIAYECGGERTTWLLDDLHRGTVWTATRIGSARPPEDGIVEELGRRTAPIGTVIE